MVTKARGGDTVNGVALGQLLLRREGMELDLAEASAENPDGTLVIKCYLSLLIHSTNPPFIVKILCSGQMLKDGKPIER